MVRVWCVMGCLAGLVADGSAKAADLVAAGAEPTHLFEQLYEQSTLPRLKLQGLALSRMQVVHDGKTAFCEVHRGDYAATGSIPSDTEELVNAPRSITGVQVAMVFMDKRGE